MAGNGTREIFGEEGKKWERERNTERGERRLLGGKLWVERRRKEEKEPEERGLVCTNSKKNEKKKVKRGKGKGGGIEARRLQIKEVQVSEKSR